MSLVAIERPRVSTRLLSLDAIRGVTVAFMIMVNNNGRHPYWPFCHADWNGFTPTDLVFPTFVFLMGVSIVFSVDSRLAHGASKSSILLHTLRRFAILVLLGLVVNGFPYFHLATLRIYGVLQRIALCFLAGTLLYLWDRRPAGKIALLIAALVGYWILMQWVPVPGLGLPGRDIPFLDKDANLVAWLDRQIFPTRLYERVRDPEGLLSNLPAIGTTLMGLLAGLWLRGQRTLEQKFRGLLGAGVVSALLGVAWNPWFPINKKLWTSSYVLVAGGLSLIGLALCYWAVEIKGWRRGWSFWLVFGSNAITAYVFSELLAPMLWYPLGPGKSAFNWIYQHVFTFIQPPGVGSLAYSIAFTLVCWLPVALLYRKKIFIKI